MSALLGGLLHPLLVPTHVLALAGLGLLTSRQRAPVRRTVLASFAAGLSLGIVSIALAIAFDDADLILLLSAAIAGLIVAMAWPMSLLLTNALFAAAGVAIELDSVPDEISMKASAVALVGTAITALLALLVVAVIAADRTREWQRIGIRVLGSWIAAAAILVLALRLS
jgi:urease accessory protein